MTLFLLGRRREAFRAMTAASATWIVLQGMKKVADRPRPLDTDPDATRQLIARPTGQSWPSSHPAVLTTFSRVASRELGVGPVGRAGLGALDATVAASRVYLGVHYPSDVISGLLIGRAVARVWPRSRRCAGRC
jgi:membrane-associated phospholipid phosphatase